MKISSRQMATVNREIWGKLRGFSVWVRWHAWLRLQSFPFQSLLQLIPNRGVLLDFGCGFGLLGYLMHSIAPRRLVIAFDPAKEKVGVANEILPWALAINSIRDVSPPIHIVAIIDVLYLLPPKKRLKTLKDVYKILARRGTVLVSFVPKKNSWRYLLAWWQEWLMVMGVNKTHHSGAIDFETEAWMKDALRKTGFDQLQRYKLPTPWPWWHEHVVYTAIKAGK